MKAEATLEFPVPFPSLILTIKFEGAEDLQYFLGQIRYPHDPIGQVAHNDKMNAVRNALNPLLSRLGIRPL